MEDKLDRIVDKLASVDSTLSAQQVTLNGQHKSLEEHMHRTELLEQSIKPLQSHVSAVEGALRLLGIIGIVVGIFGSIYKIMN